MKTIAQTEVREVMETLAGTYHGRGAVELDGPYQVLVSLVVSQRTKEEQTTVVSQRVFAKYPDLAALAEAVESELFTVLLGSEYREVKAPRLIAMARILVEQFAGRIPDDIDSLVKLPGIGRKTANCLLIYAFNREALCIDTHAHKITNRLGWVHTKTPDQTETALQKVMPRDLWAGSNRLFLQHGREICLSSAPPRCSLCPIRSLCEYGQDPDTRKQ